jgi:hypothetical protein
MADADLITQDKDPFEEIDKTEKDVVARTNKKIQVTAENSIEIIRNELKSTDPKIRLAAASKGLEVANYGGKSGGNSSVVVNINMEKLADGLREIRKVGFKNEQGKQ